MEIGQALREMEPMLLREAAADALRDQETARLCVDAKDTVS